MVTEFRNNFDSLDTKERLYALCKADPFYFATRFCYTFDERDGSWKLYPDWNYLNDALDDIRSPGNKYWLKSQRMLITISFCIEHLWEFLFDTINGVWIGKNERAVDNGGAFSDWNSAFGKMRMIYDKTPGWLREMCLGKAYHSKEIWKYLRMLNPKNGNVIMGQCPTPDAGVGEGFTRATVDEAASVAYLRTIHTNLSQSCKENRNYISFPLGRNNFFASIHFTDNHFTFKKKEIHWRLNPNYTDEWYVRQKQLMTSFEIAQRLDMSFEDSAVGKVVDKFSYSKHVKDTPYIPELPVHTWWDYGFKDATSIAFVQYDRVNNKLRVFDWIENTFTDYHGNAKDYLVIKEKYGFTNEENFGDPAAKAVEQSSGISLNDRYASEYSINIMGCDSHETISVLDELNNWFELEKIQVDPKCVPFIEACQYWEWPKDAKGNPKSGATQPAHNKFSHAGKAAEYGFMMTCMQDRDISKSVQSYINRQESFEMPKSGYEVM